MNDIDAHGKAVARFYTEARNLSKVRLLHELISEMYTSGDWRDYDSGSTRVRWRECEFDYFLISCDIKREDAYGVFAYQRSGHRVAEAMASDDPRKRRRLEDAAASYQSPGPEGLLIAAKRLGWVNTRGQVVAAVPERARVLARTGETKDEQARKARRKAVGERRDVLDACAAQLVKKFSDVTELRYIVDELRKALAKLGRPSADYDQWRRDVRQFGDDIAGLARHWKITRHAANRRKRQISGT